MLGSSVLCTRVARNHGTAITGVTKIKVSLRENQTLSLFFLSEFLIVRSGNIIRPQC